MNKTQYPTQIIQLPSRGWYYPESHPLSNGTLEVYYMTARHEDILTSRNLIQRGVVIDKLMESLIAQKDVKYDDLLMGDKNGLIVASRILGYGKKYPIAFDCPRCGTPCKHEIDLELLEDKDVEFLEENRGKNEFTFVTPLQNTTIKFKLLTHRDEKSIEAELEAMRKANIQITKEVTTRMRRSIISVNGDTDGETIRSYIDSMPAQDSKAFREYARKINPDVDLTFEFSCEACGHQNPKMEVPIDVNFFWPSIES